ncbi:MAG: ArsC/Spx/MgsR family protein [Candidatus Eutrophobiaceae bacterium]
MSLLSMKPCDILRRKETAFAQANLDRHSISDDDILAAIETHPILLEHPIIVSGNRAIIGYLAENALELLK